MTAMLKITQHETHTVIQALRRCSVRWSVDTVTWHDMATLNRGMVLRDYDAPEDKPRSYSAVVDGQVRQNYLTREAELAFADMLGPWFGGPWLGNVRSFEHLSHHAIEHSRFFVNLDQFIRARIAESDDTEVSTRALEVTYGKCYITPEGHPKPEWVPCAPNDFGEMLNLARRWDGHPDFREEWRAG